MDIDKKIEHLEVNVAGLFDMLAGVTQATTHLIESILTVEQRTDFVEWLAIKTSETDTPGRVYLAQLGANISEQARFVKLLHIAGQEFLDQKKKDRAEGKNLL